MFWLAAILILAVNQDFCCFGAGARWKEWLWFCSVNSSGHACCQGQVSVLCNYKFLNDVLHFKVELDLRVKPKLINKNCPPSPPPLVSHKLLLMMLLFIPKQCFSVLLIVKQEKKINLFSIFVGLLDEFLTSCRLEQFQV